MLLLRARLGQPCAAWCNPLPGVSGLAAFRRGSSHHLVLCAAHDKRGSVADTLYDVRVVAGLSGVGQAAELLADAFDDLEDWEASPLERQQYQLKLAAVLSWQALMLQQQFMTLNVADTAGGPPAGVATLTPNAGAQAIPGKLPKALQPLRIAVVSNMAVLPNYRRRGLGAALLAACEREAARQGYNTTALLVHQYNEAAARLYEGRGYVEVPEWEDQAWLDSVAKSRVGPARRVLMVKQLAPAKSLR